MHEFKTGDYVMWKKSYFGVVIGRGEMIRYNGKRVYAYPVEFRWPDTGEPYGVEYAFYGELELTTLDKQLKLYRRKARGKYGLQDKPEV